MVDAVLSFAVETIGKLLVDEANFLQGVTEKVKLLHKDLEDIKWFLKYADTKQSARESVLHWVSKFRDIAYEASDTVEDYAFRVAISRRKEGFANKLQRYACILGECHTRHNLGLEISSLRTRISDLTKNFSEYGAAAVMEGEGSSSVQQQLRRTYSVFSKADEEDFVGLENDGDLFVKYLLNEGEVRHHPKVVSIYGMGGLGKTTLAKKVYHHPRLRQYFEGFAWFCVLQEWKTKDILVGILVKLIPDQKTQIMKSTEELLVSQLHSVMQERKCLVILDDIRSNDAWDCIKHAFCLSEQGSKLLLTTRNRDVAVHVDPYGYHYQLRFLTNKESWQLLKKKSLRNRSAQDSENFRKLKELGKKMVKYCGGLPLAVVVLGGTLETKESLNEWITVHENIKSYLERGQVIGQSHGPVPQILAFSFYDLPYQLKSCFVYLGKFKEDSEIEAERLYQMWMAEGMVLESDRIGQESMMNVAERYLGELAQRCMVQVELQEEWPAITKFKSCRLHDLMRDLCLIKAKEENFFKVDDFQQKTDDDTELSADSSSSFQRIYRLVIRTNPNDLSKYVPPQKEQAKHIRSFMFFVVNDDKYIETPLPMSFKSQFKNFKMLRVLVVEYLMHDRMGVNYYEDMIGKYRLMDSIGNLIHLRYLGLRGCSFNTFPSSFGNLQHLKTLDLREVSIYKIPDVLWKMENLRYLYLTRDMKFTGSKFRFDGLSKLEILESFDTKFYDSKSLSKLNNLRFLKAFVEEFEDLEPIINHISNLNHLCITELAVRFLGFRKNSEKGSAILERMLFCQNLHKLKISSTLSKKLPHYQPHFSPGLCELELWRSKIEEDPMATLEKLPNLRTLVLDEDSFVGKEMICHALGFPQLRILQLTELPNLENWQVDEGAMPKLKDLTIKKCKKLDMIPDELMSITALEAIEFWGMPLKFLGKVVRFKDQVEKHYGGICLGPSIICTEYP